MNANADIQPSLRSAGALYAELPHHQQQGNHQNIQPRAKAAQEPIINGGEEQQGEEADQREVNLVWHAADDVVVNGVLGRAGDHQDAEDD